MMTDQLQDEWWHKFADDLWIKRRQEMNPVFVARQKLLSQDERDSDDELDFLNLLKLHCSGQHFEGLEQESQFWAELLNMMQISKKFNHRSVRFRDLIKSREVILANRDAIMRINDSAKLCHSIVSSINRLESWTSNQFSLQLDPENAESQLEQIRLSTRRLEEHCRQPLSAIRIELKSIDNLSNSLNSFLAKQILIWDQKIDKLTTISDKLAIILDNLDRFESKLIQLRPLIEVTNEPKTDIRGINQQEDSIDRCKELFAEVISFHKKLYSSLKRLSQNSKKDVRLWRLLTMESSSLVTNLLGMDLDRNMETLDRCRQILDELMMNLRLEFGRFYFISDLELLTVIVLNLRLITESQTDTSISRLVSKIFNSSITSFVVDSKRQLVIGVMNPNNELIELSGENSIALRKDVNYYQVEVMRILNEVQRKLRRSLQDLLYSSLMNIEKREEIDWSLPIQLLDLSEQIKFCERFENCIGDEVKLNQLSEFYHLRFTKLVSDSPTNSRLKQSAAISITVQFISRIDACRSVTQSNDWHWLSLARFYLINHKNVEVRIGAAKFSYRFDYLSPQDDGTGSYKRLISTQLTDRCILATAQSIGLFRLGACPSGPAGSGKTESVKALGRLLGCQVLVHNCDESNDSQSMDRLIWGLAHTGLWGCLDEFNRLSEACLSSVCGTLEQIQAAIGSGLGSVELIDGSLMPLDETAAFFVTLNPVEAADGQRYLGRRRLPANLRHLFIPVTMTQVQIEPIVEESLLSLNLVLPVEAKSIAIRLTRFLDRMVHSLSPHGQWLCEWDLRLAMAIVKRLSLVCGSIKLDSIDNELCKAIECEVKPRLRQDEIKIFKTCLRSTTNDHELELSDSVSASDQLEAQLLTRAGVIIVGPPKSGKSMVWRQLYAKLTEKSIHWMAINPQACERDALFGHYDRTKFKWTDGLLTTLVREALDRLSEEETLRQVWLVLDGPIDPDWIEALNSVMDDNRVLTLASGERLMFEPNRDKCVKLILETSSLEYASPATISRFGLVYKLIGSIDEIRQTKNLLIIDTNASRGYKLSQIHDIIKLKAGNDKQFRICDYVCQELSSCSDALDLMMKQRDRANCFIFHNVDLIQSNKWGVRNFMEFVQFALDYQGFYDESHSFQKLDALIVLVTSSIDQLESRVKTGSDIIKLEDGKVDNRIMVNIEDLGLKIRQCSSPIVSVASRMSSVIESFLRDDSQIDLFEMRNSHEVLRAIEQMEKILTDRESFKKTQIFLLLDSKISLMQRETVKKFMHLINRLNEQRIAKLIHSTAKIEGRFWPLVGELWTLNEAAPSDLTETHQMHSTLCHKLSHLKDQQVLWLRDKLMATIHDMDSVSGAEFVDLVCAMITRFRSKLTNKGSALAGSLKRLTDFEKQVESVELRCEKEEQELAMEQDSLNRKLEELDLAMTQAADQRDQLELSIQRQQVKSSQVEEQRRKLDNELATVRQKVEQSKAEVGEHLKPEALNEIRALRAPPKIVQDILEVLFVLLGKKDNSWSSIKSYLARSSLKDELTRYDFANNLNDQLLKQVSASIKGKQDSFNPVKAQRASKAVVPILNWIQATIEFGKTMTRVKPLSSRMRELELEAEAMEKESQTLLFKLKEHETKVNKDREECNRIKAKIEEAESAAKTLKSQIDRARLALRNSDKQTSRWRQVAESIGQYLEGCKLLKMCLMMSQLARKVDTSRDQLDRWKKQFEIDGSDESLANDMLNLISLDSDSSSLYRGKVSSSRLLQLIALQLGFSFRVHQYPALMVTMSRDKAADSLASCAILCKDVKDVCFVDCQGPPLRWTRLADSNLSSSDRLLVLELTSSSSLLDVIYYLDSLGASSANRRILLMGDPRDLPKSNWNLLTVNLSIGIESRDEMRHSMVWALMSKREPELQFRFINKTEELSGKKHDANEMESRLIERLAVPMVKRDTNLDEELIHTLQQLDSMNKSLDHLVEEREMIDEEISKRRGEIEQLSDDSLDFYIKHLAHLNELSRFYNEPFSRFVKCLISDYSDKKLETILQDTALRVAESMRADHRSSFLDQLKQAGKPEVVCRSLHKIISNVLDQEFSRGKLKIGLVLHDPRESSPQLELDEILNQMENLHYVKIYASEELGKKLDNRNAIDTFFRSSSGHDTVICIANAHLAAKWLSSNLKSVILRNAPNERITAILVAECCSLDDDLQFESTFIDELDLRCWHERSCAKLQTRLKLLKESLPINCLESQQLQKLVEDMVLLHAVCQISSRSGLQLSNCQMVNWRANYMFDSDQLILAFRTLIKIAARDQSNLRQDIGNQLIDFVYGSRMENSEDEETLKSLVDAIITKQTVTISDILE